jgi:hypothetical protein
MKVLNIARLFEPRRYIGRHRAPSALSVLTLSSRQSRSDNATVAPSGL